MLLTLFSEVIVMAVRRRYRTEREIRDDRDKLDRRDRWDRRDRVERNYYSYGHIGYFLGVIGAAVYFVSQANGFWMILLGILKAIVWPAYAVYALMALIGA